MGGLEAPEVVGEKGIDQGEIQGEGTSRLPSLQGHRLSDRTVLWPHHQADLSLIAGEATNFGDQKARSGVRGKTIFAGTVLIQKGSTSESAGNKVDEKRVETARSCWRSSEKASGSCTAC